MNDHFLKLTSNLELDSTLAESISTRHNAIRTYLQNNHPSFKDSKLIGSVARKTRINPGRVSAKGQACIDEFVRDHPRLFTHTSLIII